MEFSSPCVIQGLCFVLYLVIFLFFYGISFIPVSSKFNNRSWAVVGSCVRLLSTWVICMSSSILAMTFFMFASERSLVILYLGLSFCDAGALRLMKVGRWSDKDDMNTHESKMVRGGKIFGKMIGRSSKW